MGRDGVPPALLAPERRAEILSLIRQNKSVLVKDLCARFSVTSETIRKDLSLLEQEGVLIKTYGGAYIQDGVANEVDASIRETLCTQSKEAIGAACAALTGAGDTLFLDESTTCLAVARNIAERQRLTVVTNSLKTASLLAASGKGKLILSGGELDRKNQCFTGGGAEDSLSSYYVDKCFISCRGADRAAGITDGSATGGRIRSLMLRHARERFLVLDHTKLDKVHFYHICDFTAVDTVVVDFLPIDAWREFFRERGIRIIEALPCP